MSKLVSRICESGVHPTLIVLGASLTLGLSLDAQASRQAPDFSEVRRILVEGMAKEQATAAAFAVVRDGSIVWEEALGWADSARGFRATPSSPFLLASLNKTFESTLAAVLSERHRIDLDKPVNDYLRTTSVSSPVYDTRLVTLRRLLMHTSGLSTFDIGCDTGRPVSDCHPPSADELIHDYGIIARPPGDEFDYSNLGYFIASEAMARVAGRSMHDLIRDEVLRPLGMTHSSIGLDSAEARLVVVPFRWGRGLVREPVTTTSGYESGRGYASAHDLALFGAFHLKAHRRDQRAILSDAAIDSMQSATVPAGTGQRYGLGWWIEDDRFGFRTVLAQGGNEGAQAWLRLIPSERVAVALLVNKGVSFAELATDAAIAAMLPKYAEGLAAKQVATASGGTPNASARPSLDWTFTGRWVGAVHAVGGNVPIELVIDSSGAARAQIGARSDVGTARFGRQLVIRLPGDLEAGNPPGIQRQISIYLRPYDGGWRGVATVRPPNATGLDGRVSYFVEIKRP